MRGVSLENQNVRVDGNTVPALAAVGAGLWAWIGGVADWLHDAAPEWVQTMPRSVMVAVIMILAVLLIYGGRVMKAWVDKARANADQARADADKATADAEELRTQRVDRISQELHQARAEFFEGMKAMRSTLSSELSQARSDVQSHTGSIAGHLAAIAGQQGSISARLATLERCREDDSAVLQAAVLDLSTLNEAVAAAQGREPRRLAVERIRSGGSD